MCLCFIPRIVLFAKVNWLLVLGIFLLICTDIDARIINVPNEIISIQSAIDTAVTGDTILVQQGTYVESVNFLGKNITVASLYLTSGDSTFISSTIIDGNSAGSVVIFENGEDSTAILIGFTIQNGDAQTGGGIACVSSGPTIRNNIISDNSGQAGGGIACQFSRAIIKDNIIRNNASRTAGAGIALLSSNATIAGNTICDNVNTAVPAVFGAGIACHESNPTISQNLICSNLGGGIGCSGSDAIIDGNVIVSNTSEWGGGLYCTASNPVITNNTFSGNSALVGGGILLRNSYPSDFRANIISFSRSGEAINCADNTQAPVISCSNIFGNAGGDWAGCLIGLENVDGNISTDPLFCDTSSGDFALRDISPCAQLNNSCGELIGALGIECTGTNINDDITELPLTFELHQNYPNPFNPTTEISYEISRRSYVEISIYNTLGQHVKTLVMSDKTVGSHSVIWDGTNEIGNIVSSGTYFYKLTAGDFFDSKKMMLIK